jgi:hypothetical protein
MSDRKRPLPLFPDRMKKWPGKKDTKRWCKGVVGREHVTEWKNKYPSFRQCIHVLTCKTCGKEVRYYMPKYWWKENRQDPCKVCLEGTDGR